LLVGFLERETPAFRVSGIGTVVVVGIFIYFWSWRFLWGSVAAVGLVQFLSDLGGASLQQIILLLVLRRKKKKT
jgi:hypothetical protein